MSFTDGGSKCGEEFDLKSSDSEEHYQTDEEENSDKSFSESITKLRNISIHKTHKQFRPRKHGRSHTGRLNVSLRYMKHTRQRVGKNKLRKHMKRKSNEKCSDKSESSLENTVEVPQKGKRCRLGGKAKGTPPSEEDCDKYDSDEDNDSSYFSRISLGYFQKFRDKSGASTSYELSESYKTPKLLLPRCDELTCSITEEMELLELQKWGMTSLVSCNNKTEKLNREEDVGRDSF